MADKNMEAQISVEFEEATSRQSLNSGETINTLWSKVKRWLSDLKAVAFSGSYIDLSDKPTTATTDTDGLMSAEDKSKLDSADNTYALKSKYGDTTINVGRKAGTAGGIRSTAEGWNTTASGDYSHAGGLYTKALHHYEVAYGKYNESKDDKVFSVGDGTSDTARHNAFEITTTGGKLHDKDIATTDLIPDLSAYAKTADVPNIKVNSAVDADTVGGKLPEKIFFDNGLTSDLDSATKSGCYAASPDTLNTPYSMWWLVDTVNFDNQFIVQKAHAIGNTANTVSYIRNYANNAWSDWTEIYTLGNKPYVTGSISVSYSADSQNFEILNFTPSAVICKYASRYENDGTTIMATPITNGFSLTVNSTEAKSMSYIAFK